MAAADNSHKGHETDLSWLLRNLIEHVPYSRGAVLLSADGLTMAAHGLDPDSADHLAAVASGLFGIARSVGTKFGSSDAVRQVVVEVDGALMFVSSAGFGSVLTVLAAPQADAGVLGYEMLQLVKSVRPFLASPLRQAGTQSGNRTG
jgi:predicted regulator of Ras-like GTPase activity (Roadblock/LC7/MglB family)